MANEVKLRLELVDVYGKPVAQQVDLLFRNQTLDETKQMQVNGAVTNNIGGLRGGPQGSYRVSVDAPAYQKVGKFINLKASGVTALKVNLAVIPNKVVKVNFPLYANLPEDLQGILAKSDSVFSFEGKQGPALYEAFDDIRRAGLLNIAAKTRATRLTNGKTVLPYIEKIIELRGDRFFAVVPKELREETKHSAAEGIFRPVNSILHHPPEGFSHAGSYKTQDHYGNLQLTFFMNSENCVADIDIDDAAGVEHIFQVVGNAVGGPTHPYNIHEIIVAEQCLDPGYSFQV